MRLNWLPQVLLDAGLKVATQDGWETRGLDVPFGPIVGVMCHHTATVRDGNMPSLATITDGRADPPLSGPLSQLGLGRDGTFYVVASGRANHAGRGAWKGVQSGNTSFIGIEAENRGVPADPWPQIQMDAYQHGVAAILTKIGATEVMCCGHKEYALPAGRKTDPDFDMDAFRAGVANILAGATPPPAPIPATDGTRVTLRRGANSDLVKEVQQAVGVTPDGDFGGETEAAVRVFQRRHNLVPDGIVGPNTWALIPA